MLGVEILLYILYNMYIMNKKSETISVSKAREQLAEITGQVRFGKKRFIFSSRGRQVAAIVPIEDLKLLEEIEDMIDIRESKEALEDEGRITLEEFLAKLGIKDEEIKNHKPRI